MPTLPRFRRPSRRRFRPVVTEIGVESEPGGESAAPAHPLVVLIGPPAAGKSRIGKRIARTLDAPFIDTDREIVAAHGPIPQIFAEHG